MSPPQHPRQTASTSPQNPSRRQAMTSTRPRSERIRRSSGPLSSQTMSTIRCPSRADFFQAVSSGDPCAKISSPSAYTFAASTAAMRAKRSEIDAKYRLRQRKRRVKTREDCSNTAVVEDAEECVPVYLTGAVLDAIDRQEEFGELHSITLWLDDLRERHGFGLKITDVDLSNGVALLDAMFIIQRDLFVGKENNYVVRELDEGGEAARVNVRQLREVLSRFPWRDVNKEDKLVESPNFNAVDVWALGGYVVLAAVNCKESEDLVNQMLGYEQGVQDDLGDVITRGLKVLGISEDGEGSECEDEAAAQEQPREDGAWWRDEAEKVGAMLGEEMERRKERERRIGELEGEITVWKSMYEEMEELVERATKKLEEARAEATRLRAEKAAHRLKRMSSSTGSEGDENEGDNRTGRRKMIQELRMENAALRRKVAEGERKLGNRLCEAQRSARAAVGTARKLASSVDVIQQ